MEAPPRRLRLTLLSLVAVNLIPIYGVVFLGWSLGSVLLLFWAESGIVAVANVVKMASVRDVKAFFYVPFFIVHYGIFMSVHLVFLVVLFIGGDPFGSDPFGPDPFGMGRVADLLASLTIPLVLLVVSHGLSLVVHFFRGGEHRTARVEQLMFQPYGRIVVMHLTIIFAGIPTLVLGQPVFALVILVLVKITVDAVAHFRAHTGPRRTKAAATEPTPAGPRPS